VLQKRIARIIFRAWVKGRASVVGGATTPKSHNRLKMSELRGAAPPPPVTVKKKMQFSESFFSAKNDFFCCVFGGICYLSLMNETQNKPPVFIVKRHYADAPNQVVREHCFKSLFEAMRFQATIPFFTRYTSLVIKHK
jgi:hypothetical protein